MLPDSYSISQALAANPGWMSQSFLQFVVGGDPRNLVPALAELVRAGKAESSGEKPPYWRWAKPDSAETELSAMSPAARHSLYRKLFDFTRAQNDLDGLAVLLAYHAERAGLREEAFTWNLRSGQVYTAAGDFEVARRHFDAALSFADTEWNQVQALLSIGNLDCHVGRFPDAEGPYRRALALLDNLADEAGRIRCAQSLAAALVEQGKYGEAVGLLSDSVRRLQNTDLSLEQGVIALHLTQVYIGLGMMRESEQSLTEVRRLFEDPTFVSLKPYEGLLEGKLEIIQGRIAPAFRIFEDAARGFEAQGDLAGKLEVLLSISAPLMEHYLIREAQTLLDQVSAWEELKTYPALELSVRMRRLALGAFSGKWIQQDLGLLQQEDSGIGRIEDWMQFWFHLSLAARRLKDLDSAAAFMGKARAVVDRIARGLNAEQKESFLRRPDVARIWRLSAPRTAGMPEEQRVKARRRLPDASPAEAATLAPPTPTSGPEK